MKVHLGCGDKFIPGWVHVDVKPASHVDHVLDLRNLYGFDAGVANEVYACHVLEHFGRHEVQGVLNEWVRIIKPGGIIRLAVPDFEAVCARYQKTAEVSEILGLVCGGQRDDYDYHKMIFDYHSLATMCDRAGLKNIRRFDWETTAHAGIDDYSKAYLPHMDKNSGLLMSLNIQGEKA